MIITNQIINDEVHLGINNKVLKFFFVHPWEAFLTSYIAVSIIILIIGGMDKVKQFALVGLPVCIVSMLIATIYHKNTCYKLTINIVTKEISLYKMFTNNIVVEDVNTVSIEIGREIILIANNNKYKIFAETLHDVVSYLPKDANIIFKGFFGKQFQKELIKTNKPLTPGQSN